MHQELVLEIKDFLAKYAGKSQGDDPEVIWSSPDAHELDRVQQELSLNRNPKDIVFPNSSWESGGYNPYTSNEGRALHNLILAKIKNLLK